MEEIEDKEEVAVDGDATQTSKTTTDTGRRDVFVLDTNVFLVDSAAMHSFGRAEIIIPITVLEEIDKFKNYDGATGANARKTARELNRLFRKNGFNVARGVVLPNGGRLKVKTTVDTTKLPKTLDKNKNDNKIMLTALVLSKTLKGKRVVLVTNDITMAVKAAALGLDTQDYAVPERNSIEIDTNGSYTGQRTLVVDDDIVENVNSDKPSSLKDTTSLHLNEFLILRSSSNPKKTALVRYVGSNKPLRKIFTSKQVSFYGVTPKNKDQRLCVDLLTDQSIDMVTITGTAGSGKTLLSLAVGLHLVMEKNAYSKLVLFRPIIPFGEDIGYLPGEKDDKMHPWLYPIWDNMYELLSNGSKTNGRNQKKVSEQIEELIAQNYLEVGALTYIKGRSLKNSFIIVDEAEDLTPNEIKMIATRVGEGSKVVFTGDITQIDNPKLNVYDCGIAKAIHALADEPSVGHITLPVSERSTLAGLVAKRL
jgi:PhoH-like ATPase